MFTVTVPGGAGRRVWIVSFNMLQVVLSCVCATLLLYCVAAVAAGHLRALGTPLQLGLVYFSFGFVLILYAAVVTLIVRARPGVLADDSSPQQSACSTSDHCSAAISGVILVAACCAPPAYLVLLTGLVPALVVLACLAVAGTLSAALWSCWACLAAGPAASGEPRQQFLSSELGASLSAQVINRQVRGRCTSRVPFHIL